MEPAQSASDPITRGPCHPQASRSARPPSRSSPPPGPFPYFPGLRPRLLPRPKHVPPPVLLDHAAARLRSRGPLRRPLASCKRAWRGLAGGGRPAPSRARCILVCPRAPPPAAPSAAPRPSRAARAAPEQNRAGGRRRTPAAGARVAAARRARAAAAVRPARARGRFVASRPPAPCIRQVLRARATRAR
jgi:hypothetical protein